MNVSGLVQFCSCAGLVLALAVLVSGAPEGNAPRAASVNWRVNEVLERVRKKYDLPGMAAAVVNSEGLVAVGACLSNTHLLYPCSAASWVLRYCFGDTKACRPVCSARIPASSAS